MRMMSVAFRIRRFLHLVLMFAGVVLAGRPDAASAEEARSVTIALIASQDAAPYREVLDGFRHYLTQHEDRFNFDEQFLQGDAATAADALQKAKQHGAQLLFTVGSLATQAALKEGGELPIVACLIVDATDLQKADNATGVVLDFPVETQLQWMQRFLPQNRTVGVLFNPQENQHKIEEAARIAQTLGIKLIAREVQSPKTLPDALNSIAREADVLWGITDQTVLSPQTIEAILLFSFRNKIPLAGLSTPWVKAGALYALDRDYTDLGAQCGEQALQIVHGKRANTLPPVPPRKVMYALNLKTARHMKIDIPQTLIDGAQQVFP
jgi:putative ABC transport system substrate-binding protein